MFVDYLKLLAVPGGIGMLVSLTLQVNLFSLFR